MEKKFYLSSEELNKNLEIDQDIAVMLNTDDIINILEWGEAGQHLKIEEQKVIFIENKIIEIWIYLIR